MQAGRSCAGVMIGLGAHELFVENLDNSGARLADAYGRHRREQLDRPVGTRETRAEHGGARRCRAYGRRGTCRHVNAKDVEPHPAERLCCLCLRELVSFREQHMEPHALAARKVKDLEIGLLERMPRIHE
eukprot:Amastigsp_a200789_2.p2 type:complete len:130 gc:universal Amastigsp_a200789_2:99-488(+)